jgi:hypothetical protein
MPEVKISSGAFKDVETIQRRGKMVNRQLAIITP